MVKFVYFDVGGVAILDFSKTNKWDEVIEEIGVKQDKVASFLKYFEELTPKIHIGLDIDSKLEEINNKFNIIISKNYSFLKDGFVSRFEPNKSIWPVVKYVKERFKIGLLTNQYPMMLKEIKRQKLLPPVSWDVVVDSSRVKLQKPDLEIYKLAEELAKAKGEEILFVENTPTNIKAAQKIGWETFLYDPGNPKLSSKRLLEYIKNIK
jgi:putative hydrolase of the HAD superfamily